MIIGISGKINSGKDTVADMIMRLEPSFEKHLFAGKLKYIAQILTGYTDQYTREGKAHFLPEWGMTVGEFQQKLGTEAIRQGLKDDAWIIALFADYLPGNNWIVTDVRFPNEALAIRQRGGVLIRINRDVMDDSGRDPSHPSETSLDDWGDWDFVINNDSDLADLARRINVILEQVCLL